jgi:hypothetical protein
MKITPGADVCLITPHRDRPECFELCERWMRNQTWDGDALWIVVDDGKVPVKATMGQTVIRREPRDDDPPHTLALNLRVALEAAGGRSRFLVCENDDFYGPTYVQTMLQWLDKAPLVGEVWAKYYHVGRRGYRHFTNHTHASLCRTGFTASALPFFTQTVERCIRQRTPSVDLKLWGNWRGESYKFHDRRGDARLCVGIKGMPGLPAANHERSDYIPDPDLERLKLWVGDDYEHYLPFLGPATENAAPPKTSPQFQARRVPLRSPEPRAQQEPLVVYTAILAGYDKLKRAYRAPGVEYVCFTDKPRTDAMGWTMAYISNVADPVLKVRELKTHPHVLFPNATQSIWIDASMTPRVNPRAIASAARDYELMISKHHARDCIVQEAEACVRLGRCDGPSLDQARHYIEAGHPEHWGLYCGGLIYRRHTETVQKFNDTWWEEFKKWHDLGASRDQISLQPALRTSGVKFGSFDKQLRGRWVTLLPHHVITPARRAAEQRKVRVCPHCHKPIEV